MPPLNIRMMTGNRCSTTTKKVKSVTKCDRDRAGELPAAGPSLELARQKYPNAQAAGMAAGRGPVA